MKHALILLLAISMSGIEDSSAQNTLLGGPCQGCEAVFEFGNQTLSSQLTMPEFESEGVQIKITGTVFEPDEVTPAKDVILYVYQTNEEGIYPKKGDEKGWARMHGYLRGWVKTDQNGRYTIYTQQPRFYRNEPAHIHLTVLEPDGSYYYVEDFKFEGDENLRKKHRNNPKPRGGSIGIMQLKKEDGILTGTRNLILRKNIN